MVAIVKDNREYKQATLNHFTEPSITPNVYCCKCGLGSVQHQSSSIHLLAIKSIFVKDVCDCTLIMFDKSQLAIKGISVLRAGIVSTTVICSLSLLKKKKRKKKSVTAVATLARLLLTISRRAETQKKNNMPIVYCQHKDRSGKSIFTYEYSSVLQHVWTNYNKSLSNQSWVEKSFWRLLIKHYFTALNCSWANLHYAMHRLHMMCVCEGLLRAVQEADRG